MELEVKTLGQLISVVHRLTNGMLYLTGDYPWNINTLGLIYIGEKAVQLESVLPDFVKSNDLKLVIESAVLEDVILNVRLQKPHASHLEIVEAFNHYYKHDGFMQLD